IDERIARVAGDTCPLAPRGCGLEREVAVRGQLDLDLGHGSVQLPAERETEASVPREIDAVFEPKGKADARARDLAGDVQLALVGVALEIRATQAHPGVEVVS